MLKAHGKTTATDFLRHSLKYTNLYRLSGTADSSPSGLQKSEEMYDDLLEYIKKLENKNINLLFDRTFFTEENYCRLGKKQYSFTKVYNRLLNEFSKLDFDIYYITLYLKNTDLYEERLSRDGKADVAYAKFGAENSIKQQEVYLQMADEIRQKYPNIKTINIANDGDVEVSRKIMKDFIGF